MHFFMPVMVMGLGILFAVFAIVGNSWLSHTWTGSSLSIATSISSITCAIALFILFNTTYYGFITKRRFKMLIIASAYLGTAIFQFVRFIGLVMIQQSVRLDLVYFWSFLSIVSWSLLFSVMIFAEWMQTVIQEKKIKETQTRWIPIIATGLTVITVWVLWMSYQSTDFKRILPHVHVVLGYLVATEQLILIILSAKNYYIEANENYLSMITAYLFFFFAACAEMIYYNGGLMAQFFVNCFMITGFSLMIRSVYRTFIGDPMKLIQNQENQLTLYAKNLEKVISKRTVEVKEINERFNSELEYAKSIQQSLLPERKFVIRNVHFVTEYFPCEKLSGDFFDIYRIDEENVGMYILDVSGHGISAALMTMFCNNFIKSTEKLIMRFRGLKPHKNLAHFFEEFNKMNFPDEMYMVVFFASYNLTNRTLTYCSGGMNSIPFVIGKEGEIEYLDQSEGFAICKLDGLFTPEYKSAQIQLKPGDRVVFYTDGIVDKEKNRVFDQEDFEKFFVENTQLSLKQCNEKLIATIYPYTGKLEDDITYFIFEI